MKAFIPSYRVLVWANKGRDAALAVRLLQRGGVEGAIVRGVSELCAEIDAGAGCALLTEEELSRAAQEQIAAALARQPVWSDFPFIVFTSGRPEASRHSKSVIDALGNVILLDRPAQARTLLGAVFQALRGRRRQYQAEREISQRDQFLAMLGHELRNPLSAILFAVELLNATEARARDVRRHHAVIERQAKTLARLVDDLLDVSRVTSGKVSLRTDPLRLSDLISRCVQSVERLSTQTGVGVKAEAVPDGWVRGDAVRLEQVLNNLLTNAIKYSPAGSTVTVAAGPVGNGWELRIVDRGIGIAPEALERIFDLFWQEEGSPDRSKGGLGIGLTLAKRLVELHGGTLEARSAGLGKGSEFIVRLPRAGSPEGDQAPAKPVPSARGPRGKVVLVEDNADVREMSRDALEILGWAVETAPDGPTGLARILEAKPDLALVDVGLPGLGGYEVAERVRTALGDRILLVAMTGYGQAEDRQRALRAGFDAHLTKPVGLDDLGELLLRLVSERANRAGAQPT